MKSFVLLWSSWSYLECQEFILLWPAWNILYCYGLPGLLWSVDSFFYTLMACLVSCGMGKVSSCFSGSGGRVVVCYSVELGELWSVIL